MSDDDAWVERDCLELAAKRPLTHDERRIIGRIRFMCGAANRDLDPRFAQLAINFFEEGLSRHVRANLGLDGPEPGPAGTPAAAPPSASTPAGGPTRAERGAAGGRGPVAATRGCGG
ncbi:MAG TPA: hypothetical protein VG406_01795 [Isosphaeraceae bacterium]|jgi:hypothetical protein|nr:hypothetical protein [Isosphaeraceae bacterium]